MAAIDHNDALAHLEDFKHVPSTTAKVDNQGIEALKDIAFGSTAGILGKYIEYPFDTVKVRLQSQRNVGLHGPVDAFKQALQAPEGPIRSLYRGISAPLLGAAVETSSLFFSYRLAQDAYTKFSPTLRKEKETHPQGKIELPFTALLLCGAASGATTSLALTPIELVKCKMQVPGTATQRSISSIIRSIFATQGLLGFWHGQLGTLIRETGGSAAWFGSYEATKILFRKYDTSIENIDDVKIWQQMLGGAAAGMSYNFVFYPADTIKSRMQTEEASLSKGRSTFLAVGRELWQQHGLKGFYRGCGITVFRAAPSSAIIFTIYEALRKFFG
ncbi:mitochondrial ornithine carrier protein [Exophiala xenobiotica]|uniref:Mitochondrial ornithine carrier protein n=1 Tax=Lithohypha guttulata TaxID=1690604 RepID=A0ABR0K9L0_9EURO|nr:mitochondrial ornithine carrier protein [Lithohypha guttulata]KAK5319293.1 mitochondrial ornithine carrier protein [Exophiala xenobiotica]